MELLARVQDAPPRLELGLLAPCLLAQLPAALDALFVPAQQAGLRIDVELLARLAERRVHGRIPADLVKLALHELRLDRDEVLDVAQHVLLHRAARVDDGTDLAVDGIPGPADTPAEELAQRSEMLVQPLARTVAALHADLRRYILGVKKTARAPGPAQPAAAARPLDDHLEHVRTHALSPSRRPPA